MPIPLPEGCEVTFVNANDGTVEGFENEDLKINCVQFHPEAHAAHWTLNVTILTALPEARVMPKKAHIKKVLIIGSGPIQIGQALRNSTFPGARQGAVPCGKKGSGSS